MSTYEKYSFMYVSTYLICPFTSPALEMKNAFISSSDSSSNTVVGSKSAAHTSIPDRSGISSCHKGVVTHLLDAIFDEYGLYYDEFYWCNLFSGYI